MDLREFPVLARSEEPYVERLAAGIGDTPSRVLVYLWRRSLAEDIEPTAATEMEIQIGTGLSRKAIQDVTKTLEQRGLVESRSIRTENPGRPPNAWRTTHPFSEIRRMVYDQHAERLLEQAGKTADEDWTRWMDQNTSNGYAVRRVTVGLNWDPNELQMPLFAAEKDGAYDERGLAVEWQSFRGSRRSIDAVLNGSADVGIAGAATVTQVRSGGEPVFPLAVLFQRPMIVLYTTREVFGEPFDSVEQLRGRKVGMPVSSETGVLSRLFLSQAGVLDNTDIVDIEGEEYDRLSSGAVDAVTGIFSDPLRIESTGTTVDSIRVADRFPIYGPTLITSKRMIRQKPGTLRRFLAGTVSGWALATQEPRDTAEYITDKTGRSPDWMTEVFEQAVEEFGRSEEISSNGWGWQTTETWERLKTALGQTGLLETPP